MPPSFQSEPLSGRAGDLGGAGSRLSGPGGLPRRKRQPIANQPDAQAREATDQVFGEPERAEFSPVVVKSGGQVEISNAGRRKTIDFPGDPSGSRTRVTDVSVIDKISTTQKILLLVNLVRNRRWRMLPQLQIR